MNISVCLLHYPVRNRHGDIIHSAVTNLDIHDIARTCCVFSVNNYFIVQGTETQKKVAEDIVDFWTKGFGGDYNSYRKQAFQKIIVVKDLAEVKNNLTSSGKTEIKLIGTSAKESNETLSVENFCKNIYEPAVKKNNNIEYLLLMGTAWGLTKEFMEKCDYILNPIKGPTNYNHLSVRSAVAIYMYLLYNNLK